MGRNLVTVRYRRLADLVELTALLQATTTGITLDQITERFDVSRRTAERMLVALRDTFGDIEPTYRNGLKHWRIPSSSRALPLRLPREIEELAKRVDLLTAEIQSARDASAIDHAIVDDVLAKSAVGIFILDGDFRVVWTNEALRNYFGLEATEIHGRDKRELIHTRIRDIMVDGEEFERRVLDTYANNSYVERFECCVAARPGREERWLRHWSQSIASGIYTGGRVEHYVELPDRVEPRDIAPAESST